MRIDEYKRITTQNQTNNDYYRVAPYNTKYYDPSEAHIKKSFLGKDQFKLSPDAELKLRGLQEDKSWSHFNTVRMILLITLLFLITVTTLVVLGGLITVLIIAVIVLFIVLFCSLNLNPFDKKTYKKISNLFIPT